MSEHVQGVEVRRVRERLGEHQAQFGQRFDVTRRTVIRWEKDGTEFYSWGYWKRDDRKTPADLWLEAVKAADAGKKLPSKSATAIATRKSRSARRRKSAHKAALKRRKSPAGNRARRRKPVTRRARAARRRRVTRRGRRR